MHITRVGDWRHDGSTQSRAWNDPTGQRTCNASRELFAAFLRRKQATVVLIGFSQGLLEREALALIAEEESQNKNKIENYEFLSPCYRCGYFIS